MSSDVNFTWDPSKWNTVDASTVPAFTGFAPQMTPIDQALYDINKAYGNSMEGQAATRQLLDQQKWANEAGVDYTNPWEAPFTTAPTIFDYERDLGYTPTEGKTASDVYSDLIAQLDAARTAAQTPTTGAYYAKHGGDNSILYNAALLPEATGFLSGDPNTVANAQYGGVIQWLLDNGYTEDQLLPLYNYATDTQKILSGNAKTNESVYEPMTLSGGEKFEKELGTVVAPVMAGLISTMAGGAVGAGVGGVLGSTLGGALSSGLNTTMSDPNARFGDVLASAGKGAAAGALGSGLNQGLNYFDVAGNIGDFAFQQGLGDAAAQATGQGLTNAAANMATSAGMKAISGQDIDPVDILRGGATAGLTGAISGAGRVEGVPTPVINLANTAVKYGVNSLLPTSAPSTSGYSAQYAQTPYTGTAYAPTTSQNALAQRQLIDQGDLVKFNPITGMDQSKLLELLAQSAQLGGRRNG